MSASKNREGEQIGGGFFVFRRGKKTGRIGIKYKRMPFEHPNAVSAIREADRLTKENPGESFAVFEEIHRTEVSGK